MNIPLNEILEKVGKALGNLSSKIQPKVHSGAIQKFWNWVDAKWYRTDLHDGLGGTRNV